MQPLRKEGLRRLFHLLGVPVARSRPSDLRPPQTRWRRFGIPGVQRILKSRSGYHSGRFCSPARMTVAMTHRMVISWSADVEVGLQPSPFSERFMVGNVALCQVSMGLLWVLNC